tara:strand:- start:228 stop:386 length:159 start_codon:yes stop_codon:yes gene_type:complete
MDGDPTAGGDRFHRRAKDFPLTVDLLAVIRFISGVTQRVCEASEGKNGEAWN